MDNIWKQLVKRYQSDLEFRLEVQQKAKDNDKTASAIIAMAASK